MTKLSFKWPADLLGFAGLFYVINSGIRINLYIGIANSVKCGY